MLRQQAALDREDEVSKESSSPSEGAQVEPQDRSRFGAEAIERELTGDLHCARCAYNLRGLSVLSVCGECGLPVKATILAIVDPLADELRHIRHPRLIQAGVLLWTFSAFAAAVLLWAVRSDELLQHFFGFGLDQAGMVRAVLVLVAASGLGAIALVRPHAGLGRANIARAAFAIVCYVPLIASLWYVLERIDPFEVAIYAQIGHMPATRIAARAITGLCVMAIVLLLRPNALTLAYRSVLVRTGRVDRQPLRALAAAAAVALAGDGVHVIQSYVAGPFGDLLFVLGVALIATGSFLLTVGLWGVTLDAWRIRRVIMAPGIGLTDIFSEEGRP
jgi:hypothetical protein